jgi:hypothetical protein
MGDKRRFKEMAKAIRLEFPPDRYHRVGDIAGGRGHLQTALRDAGFKEVVTFDKRPVRAAKTRYFNRLFTLEERTPLDLLVALHPDEATDVTIAAAIKRGVPFAVCPCCIKPTVLKPSFGSTKISYRTWIHRLRQFAEKEGFSTVTKYLKISGKNCLIIGKPRNAIGNRKSCPRKKAKTR